jgi:hypothetical protein
MLHNSTTIQFLKYSHSSPVVMDLSLTKSSIFRLHASARALRTRSFCSSDGIVKLYGDTWGCEDCDLTGVHMSAEFHEHFNEAEGDKAAGDCENVPR